MSENLLNSCIIGGNKTNVVFVALSVIYLQVCELPGLVIQLSALTGERLPEVHFDQLPVRPVADVAKHTENTHTHSILFTVTSGQSGLYLSFHNFVFIHQ